MILYRHWVHIVATLCSHVLRTFFVSKIWFYKKFLVSKYIKGLRAYPEGQSTASCSKYEIASNRYDTRA